MTVAALIGSAQGYASQTIASANTALTGATTALQAIGYSIPNFLPVSLPSPPSPSVSIVVPSLAPIALDLPTEPSSAPLYQDIPAIEAGVTPLLTATPPTVNLPSTPAQLAAFLEAAPGIDTTITFPSPPSELMNPMISAPNLVDRVEPALPQVSLPVFDTITPVNDSVAPTDLKGTFSTAYRDASPATVTMVNGYVDAMLAKYNPRYSEQMGRIEAQLATYLNGGTGLNPSVENAIYERARDKNEAETRRVRNTAYKDAADRGFTLPPGALLSAVQQSRQAGADNNARASTEITVLQAEMEQKNLQFAVTTSASLRTTMLSASLSYMQNLVSINAQSLDYAKTILNAVIETYNTAVKAFGLKLDAYKAEAVVYETRLKSSMAGIELYQAEVKALEALTSVDRTKVDVYRARIDSLRAYAEVYKAQIEAVIGRTSLEKLKLEVFQVKVQAYTAQVQGKTAEFQGYTAAIEGETSKVKIFGAQVEAFNSQVQSFKANIEAKSEVVRAAAITNQARAAQYAATLAGYTAVVTARGEKARTQLENQRQTIVAFQAQVQAQVGLAQVQSEYYRAVSSVAIKNAELRITAQVQGGESQRAYGASVAQLALGSAQVYGQLAGSAMSGMTSLSAELKNE
jgi:hypothetical protein